MKKNRRQFIYESFAGLATLTMGPYVFGRNHFLADRLYDSKPWIELSKAAYLHNVLQINKIVGGKPIIAVLKNNAYGLGDVQVAKILDNAPGVVAVALVKDERAIALKTAGFSKPVLLMGDFDSATANALVEQEITLSIFSKASFKKISELVESTHKTINVALYIDTGLGRMGIPYKEAIHIGEEVAKNNKLRITHTFSTLTSPKDFAEKQIQRFEEITKELNAKGITTGIKHLAPSLSLLDLPKSHQEAVRPGILLHGSFPMVNRPEAKQYPLQVPYRLKAPIIRLEKLKAGDTIGFSRFYKIKNEEWIATLPVGWADGYDSEAENGALVLLGGELYPVVNVNASHTNVSLGFKTKIKVGDVATLIGPDRPEITPEGFGKLIKGHNYLQINYKESIPKKTYESF
ncbi:alanine racemase [Ulvibacterium sp.]|uniref:alanine racemase n=1 Tax=Ulvibacterium sp. TaxID=2665914 RepID=UPI002606FF5D|nr:alanine racemase [Ulvibacterium sp.]